MEASAGDTAMAEENISSNKDYLKDWKIDFVAKSATHVTGLTFKYIEEGLMDRKNRSSEFVKMVPVLQN